SANDTTPITIRLNYSSTLLKTGIPTTFQVSIPALPAPNTTLRFPLVTPATAVESALNSLPGIGAGGVTVSMVRSNGTAPRVVVDAYTITPTKNFFTLGPTHDFVVDTSNPALVGTKIFRALPPHPLTKEQQDLFQTESERRQFFD